MNNLKIFFEVVFLLRIFITIAQMDNHYCKINYIVAGESAGRK